MARALVPILVAALAGAGLTFAPATTENAKANGDTRTIYLHHSHTHESIAATYMVDGQYDPAILEKLNYFLRDWRRDETTHMDPRLFDVIWTVYRESGSAQPIEVMSAYRSPETNAMLRRRSRLVAEHSQHILGKAMDQHYVDVPMSRIREIAMKLQRGGVGFYPTAGTPFVHMDVGGVRHWPRMSYDQLARLFPDGKTVHIPSNGQPLPGYEEARAELEARGDNFNYPTASEVKSKGFFAWLFGGGDDEEDSAAAAQTKNGRRAQQRIASIDPNASGSIGQDAASGMNNRDGGARAFTMASASPPATSSSSYGTLSQQRPVPIQTPPTPKPLATPEQPVADDQPDPHAQEALALAMADQERAKQDAATKADAAAKAADIVAALPSSPIPTLPPQASVDPTVMPTVPMPPRRPIELASPGPAAPMPPGRPPQLASLVPPAQPLPAARHDAIGALLEQTIPSRTAGLPALITHGTGAPRPSTPPAQVLAFAAPLPLPAATGQIAVPIPTPRPNFVAARLDRSNFRALTGKGDTSRIPVRSGMGSAVTALRPAAKTSLGAMAGEASPGATIGFGSRASDLATDHFSGAAVKPREHVVTSGGDAGHATAD